MTQHVVKPGELTSRYTPLPLPSAPKKGRRGNGVPTWRDNFLGIAKTKFSATAMQRTWRARALIDPPEVTRATAKVRALSAREWIGRYFLWAVVRCTSGGHKPPHESVSPSARWGRTRDSERRSWGAGERRIPAEECFLLLLHHQHDYHRRPISPYLGIKEKIDKETSPALRVPRGLYCGAAPFTGIRFNTLTRFTFYCDISRVVAAYLRSPFSTLVVRYNARYNHTKISNLTKLVFPPYLRSNPVFPPFSLSRVCCNTQAHLSTLEKSRYWKSVAVFFLIFYAY